MLAAIPAFSDSAPVIGILAINIFEVYGMCAGEGCYFDAFGPQVGYRLHFSRRQCGDQRIADIHPGQSVGEVKSRTARHMDHRPGSLHFVQCNVSYAADVVPVHFAIGF